MDVKKILVTGATGKQGGAAIDALLSRGDRFEVFALTRNTDSSKARDLKARGVKLVKGDLQHKDSLVTAFSAVDAVFLVSVPEPFNEEGCETEKRQGLVAVEAAKEAKLKFMIYTSCASCQKKTGIPHFESKAIIENALVASGVPNFILRPVCFFDNIGGEGAELKQGTLTFLTIPTCSLQWIAASDIGEFAAIGFSDPSKFVGTALDIAGDTATGPQMAQAMSAVRGNEPWAYSNPPLWILMCFAKELGIMTAFFNTNEHGVGKAGFDVDIEKCRSIHPGLLDRDAYFRKAGYEKATFAGGSCALM